MFKKLYNQMVECVKRGALAVAAAVTAGVAMITNAAHATPTPVETLFADVDLDGLETGILTILGVMIGIAVIFAAYKFIKRALNR